MVGIFLRLLFSDDLLLLPVTLTATNESWQDNPVSSSVNILNGGMESYAWSTFGERGCFEKSESEEWFILIVFGVFTGGHGSESLS